MANQVMTITINMEPAGKCSGIRIQPFIQSSKTSDRPRTMAKSQGTMCNPNQRNVGTPSRCIPSMGTSRINSWTGKTKRAAPAPISDLGFGSRTAALNPAAEFEIVLGGNNCCIPGFHYAVTPSYPPVNTNVRRRPTSSCEQAAKSHGALCVCVALSWRSS